MSGRSVRRGKGWEREVARDLSAATGRGYARVLTETRDGNRGDVRAADGVFVVQCKMGRRPNVHDALTEALEAAGPGKLPVGAIKRTHGPGVPAERFAVVPWSTWLEIVARLEGGDDAE